MHPGGCIAALALTEGRTTSSASSTETNIWAVGGRLSFIAVLAGLLYAAFFPAPHVFVSTHVAHFAGFYVFALACSASAKRVNLIPLGCSVAALAVALEVIRALIWLPLTSSYLDCVGDLAGVVAALGPMLLQKLRAGYTSEPR